MKRIMYFLFCMYELSYRYINRSASTLNDYDDIYRYDLFAVTTAGS